MGGTYYGDTFFNFSITVSGNSTHRPDAEGVGYFDASGVLSISQDTRSISFAPNAVFMCQSGYSTSVLATVTPSSAASSLTFTSAAPGIATVSFTAPILTVTGVGVGTTQITATDSTGLVWGRLSVEVGTTPPFGPAQITAAGGYTPSSPLEEGVWGETYPEKVDISISACLGSDGDWHALLTGVNGRYSIQTRLLPADPGPPARPAVQEVEGAIGNSNYSNFCAQVTDLQKLSAGRGSWYMLAAIDAHENVHAAHLKPDLEWGVRVADTESRIEALVAENSIGKTVEGAVLDIKTSEEFLDIEEEVLYYWGLKFGVQGDIDHGVLPYLPGPSYQAEQAIVNPMITHLCTYFGLSSTTPCAACP